MRGDFKNKKDLALDDNDCFQEGIQGDEKQLKIDCGIRGSSNSLLTRRRRCYPKRGRRSTSRRKRRTPKPKGIFYELYGKFINISERWCHTGAEYCLREGRLLLLGQFYSSET